MGQLCLQDVFCLPNGHAQNSLALTMVILVFEYDRKVPNVCAVLIRFGTHKEDVCQMPQPLSKFVR